MYFTAIAGGNLVGIGHGADNCQTRQCIAETAGCGDIFQSRISTGLPWAVYPHGLAGDTVVVALVIPEFGFMGQIPAIKGKLLSCTIQQLRDQLRRNLHSLSLKIDNCTGIGETAEDFLVRDFHADLCKNKQRSLVDTSNLIIGQYSAEHHSLAYILPVLKT